MKTTSTYEKSFFLPGETLTHPKKVFTLPKEDLVSKKINFSKKDIDMTKNVIWICSKCGHTHVGATTSSSCPICNSDYKKKQ